MREADECLDDDVLAQWVHGLLTGDELRSAQAHVDHCSVCRVTFAALVRGRGDETVGPSLAATVVTADVSERRELSSGARLGRYVVLETVGQGAMGVVYAAYDPTLDRKVALKLLNPRFSASVQASERLMREARSLARLSHPNVVPAHDVGMVDGQVFIAMQFVEGQTLRHYLAGQRTLDEKLAVLLQAGRGLAAAHRAGLVHRDFKPDNVLVDKEGRAQVTDFGLARALGEGLAPGRASHHGELAVSEASLTTTGELLGTPRYMSPEQLRALPVEQRGDQFSFCVTVYEALYEARPFAGDSLRELTASVHRGLAATPPRVRGVTAAMQRALERGLAVDPAARHPSMEPLLEALTPLRRAEGRRWASAALAALVAAAAIAVVLKFRPACPSADDQLTDIWDTQVRRSLQLAFEGTHQPFAPVTWAATQAGLQRYAAAWLAMQRDACEAAQVRREQPASVWALRRACLERRRTELNSVVKALGRADARVVERAPSAVTQLTPIEVCADVEVLENLQKVPEAPALRAEVEAVRSRLADGEAELWVRGELGAEMVASLDASAATLKFDPLTAEVQLLAARAALARQHWDEAKRSLFSGLLAAERSGNMVLTIEILTRLVEAEVGAGQLPLAHQWADLAVAALALRGTREPTLGADLALQRSVLANKDLHFDQAATLAEQALQQLARAGDGQTEAQAVALSQLGSAVANRGDFARALQLEQRALAMLEKLLGAEHPRVVAQRVSVGTLLAASASARRPDGL